MTAHHARLRRASIHDSRTAFDIFLPAIRDLTARLGTPWEPDPDELWAELGPMYEYFGEHAAEFWIAEDVVSGIPIGYARSMDRGGLFELTELFVHPDRQSSGIGADLMQHAFPSGRGDVRAIIATTDVRAQARYYHSGTVARFPITTLEGAPRLVDLHADVDIEPATPDHLGELQRLETDVLEFDRGDEFHWLLERREGYLYRRGGAAIGFAFVSRSGSGPIAARTPEDQLPILSHLERRANELAMDALSLEVPMINAVAMNHLLGRGFRMDPFYTFLMSNRPFGHFDRFIGFAPPFVL